jgi:hypothetical protein
MNTTNPTRGIEMLSAHNIATVNTSKTNQVIQ